MSERPELPGAAVLRLSALELSVLLGVSSSSSLPNLIKADFFEESFFGRTDKSDFSTAVNSWLSRHKWLSSSFPVRKLVEKESRSSVLSQLSRALSHAKDVTVKSWYFKVTISPVDSRLKHNVVGDMVVAVSYTHLTLPTSDL